MNPSITAAIIAACISLVAAIISYVANRKALLSQAKRHEQEMQRRLTEKLYELRLECYQEAFEITAMLSGDMIFNRAITEEYIKNVREKITSWNRTKAGLIMSQRSIRSYYRLKDALNVQPKNGVSFTEAEIKKIWEAKNDFRRNLRRDVNLLYVEESKPDAAA